MSHATAGLAGKYVVVMRFAPHRGGTAPLTTRPTQNGAWHYTSATIERGSHGFFRTRSIPHSGQRPGDFDFTSGCIGQVYTTSGASPPVGMLSRVCAGAGPR